MDTSAPQGRANSGELFCPTCGQQNPAGNRFCGQCGNALSMPTPLSAPAPTFRDTSPVPQPSSSSRSADINLGERERRLVKVLFCDLVGFTPLSERLDPEDVREIQSLYFASMKKEMIPSWQKHGLLQNASSRRYQMRQLIAVSKQQNQLLHSVH